MKYPNFLKKNETIGICAPSSGVGHKLASFDLSINNLKKYFKIIETEHVRNNDVRGGSIEERVRELHYLFLNDEVKMIICASGGNFLYEILKDVDFEMLAKQNKWLLGASDPTCLLYPLTTKYDVATLYGVNAGAFDQENLHESLKIALEYLQGNLQNQYMYDKYEPQNLKTGIGDYQLTETVKWDNVYGDDKIHGRLIGGCLDVIKDLLGTPYDGALDFINRYKDDGIIWYFDIYAMSAEIVYLTMMQMEAMGYFKNCRGILVGRVLFKSSDTGMTYKEAFTNLFKDIPIVMDMDIGHTSPKVIMINGAIIDVCLNEKMLKFTLE